MKDHKETCPIGKMAKALGVSKSGYYAFIGRKPSNREQEDEHLFQEILEIYLGGHQIFGSKKITKEINKRRKQPINHKRIERLMKKHELYSKVTQNS